MKTCTSCGINKPIEDYYCVNKVTNLRAARCKKCSIEAARSRYENKSEQIKAYHKEYNKKNKAALKEKRAAHYQDNKELHASRGKAWRAANQDKILEYGFKKAYGLTLSEYNAMFTAQDGKCKLCLGISADGRRLSVDHCHSTGKVRGLLCNSCNLALGMFKDNTSVLERAIDYVRRHR